MFEKLMCILFLMGVTFSALIKADDKDNEKICMTESLFKSVLKTNKKDQCQGLSKHLSQGERPVFFAFLKNHITFSGSDVLKFDDVKTNIGNGYNKDKGLFTAPNDGVYVFGCLLVANGDNIVHYWIYKNEEAFNAGYVAKTENANSNTQYVIMELKKGDTASVRHRGSTPQKLIGVNFSYVFGYQLN